MRASYLAMFGKGERKKERRCERKGKKKKEREREKKKKNKFKDDTKSLDGLKIEKKSMHKLEESG